MTGDVTAPRPAGSVGVRAAVAAFVVDVALVLLFAAVGRRSHAESGAVVGVLRTAWPFVAGLVLGWVVALGWHRTAPLRVRDAVPVWVLTVAGGMLLRVATGAGTAPSFVVVATVVLGVFLLGWRALAALVRHRASR
jgi:chromate transport protein ChrA